MILERGVVYDLQWLAVTPETGVVYDLQSG